ncbi:MAG: 2-isopropylmalate synthase, partial [Candidatus Wukongarchaeota archaeon]|nr:2-isopropylmalate synthase [Candidatus Wukongarchaeota archaeon]
MFFSEPKVSLPAYVAIFDTTLRDGEQMPGCALRPEEKTEIAHQLDMLGVDVIEAGFPIASEGERQAIKSITKEGLNSEICGLARSNKADIDAVISCNVDRVHTFIATSALHMEKKLKMTPEEVIEHAVSGVEYVKDHGLKSEFSAEDATRSDIEFLKKVFASAVEAGADVVDIPDTVGVAIPRTMFHIVREVKSAVNVPVAVHCHDDFGLAVANSLASVEAGAEQVHVCVNGIGERAGNASLEEVALALQVHYGIQTGIRTEEIYKTSQLVTRLMRVLIAPNKAIVGANAFAHESGIHSHGVLVSPQTYEPIAPEMVGARRKFVAGKHAGKHGVKAILESIGIYPTENQLDEIIYRVKELGDKGIKVSDADLEGVARALI